jgi:phosphoribosylformylglycinamidine cyclo-ligase
MDQTQKPLSYKDAGVDIAAQDEALARSKASIRASFTPGVLGDVGAFGGLFDPAKMGFGEGTILVSSADGVGTKLDVAKRAGIHDTVGRDLVNHCINDILVQGATPLFFMDYVGTGKLDPTVVSDLIRGCAEACRASGLALLGGETAEMPGLYAEGDFDLVGFIVGAVHRDKLIDGSKVRAGQTLIALPSAGLHTNGYSLARKIVFERLKLELSDCPKELGGRSVQDALLAEHRSYASIVAPLLNEDLIAGMAHITGGGLPGNVNRMLSDTDAEIALDSWQVPGLFRLLVEGGGVERNEAYKAFNMGVGLVLAIEPDQAERATELLRKQGETPWVIGRLVPGSGKVHLK